MKEITVKQMLLGTFFVGLLLMLVGHQGGFPAIHTLGKVILGVFFAGLFYRSVKLAFGDDTKS